MESIVDEYQLTKEKFEWVVSHGTSLPQVLTIFQKTGKEMDDWCKENYKGHDFKYMYNCIREMCLDKFLGVCQQLGYRGNPSALAIINQSIQNLKQDNTVRIVFENNLQSESEEDQEDE